MQLKQDAAVMSADGKDVGRLARVVIDPRSNEITHIVVHRGVLFTEDKLVPISLVAAGTAEKVTLRDAAAAQDLTNLPNFEETHFIPTNNEDTPFYPVGQAPALYWYPPVGAPILPPPIIETTKNIPEGTIALREGAQVITAEGESVGTIEQVLTDPLADRVTHFLISQGLLFPEKKLIPMNWVSEVNEDEVRLAVGKRTLENLQHYYAH
jgi:sporulation protein YlmC with PRC-barrel domain